jgi:stearoyl-CoA desaturase (delta-9 desaturase)
VTEEGPVSTEFVDTGPAGGTRRIEQLALPAGIKTRRILWLPAFWVVSYHLLALLALLPWFFSWTGVALAILGDVVFGVLGINLCYHRLLTHRSFRCPKWFEHALAVLGLCCVQDTPMRWVAVHRAHHQHADEQPDPHTPLVNFLWAHVGWVIVENPGLHPFALYDRYARDLLKDPFYRRLERKTVHLAIIMASWMLFFAGGFLASLLLGGTIAEAVQFGLSLLVWGVFVRTVAVWHQTWAVNSLSHMWGYRNYATDDDSRNNVFVGIVSNGEGWHNNHHADQRSARHGHHWWELDTTYLIIRLFTTVGLIRDVVTPKPDLAERFAPGAPRAANGENG